MSYIDVTGKTEEEAIRKALQQLQMDRDDVSVEILERAKSGFLGIGSSPARVRVTYGQQEPEAPAAPVQPEKKPEKKPEPKPQPKPQPELILSRVIRITIIITAPCNSPLTVEKEPCNFTSLPLIR